MRVDRDALGDLGTPRTAPNLPRWLAEMAERLPDLVAVTSGDGRTNYLNPAGRRMLGLTGNERLRIHDLYPTDELVPIVEESLPTAIRDGTWTGRTAMKAADGKVFPVLLTINAHRDDNGQIQAMSFIGRDLRGLEDELSERRRNEGMFRTIAERCTDLIAVLDEYGQTLYVSPSSLQILGVTPDEALRLDNWSRLHPDDVPAARAALEGLLRDPEHAVRLRMRYLHQAGQWITLDATAVARLDDTSVNGILLYARDVSAAAAEEAQLRERLETMKDQQTDRGVLLDSVAHDMKQPLSPILLQVHLLRHLYGESDPRTRRALQIIDENAQRLERFISDFRDAAQIERDSLPLQRYPIDLGTRVASVTTSLMSEAQIRDIRLDRVCYGTFPVFADADRIDQVLFNLIRNAFKFTPAGGRVSVQVRRIGDEAVCSVADTGCGMAPEALERLFAPFVQVHDPRETAEKGTGLGLSICRGIIERHGGRIWAESAGRGRGSTFTFAIPLHHGADA